MCQANAIAQLFDGLLVQWLGMNSPRTREGVTDRLEVGTDTTLDVPRRTHFGDEWPLPARKAHARDSCQTLATVNYWQHFTVASTRPASTASGNDKRQ